MKRELRIQINDDEDVHVAYVSANIMKACTKETREYLKKREIIINAFVNTPVIYNSDIIHITTKVDFWGAVKAADLILERMHIEKPQQVSRLEKEGIYTYSEN